MPRRKSKIDQKLHDWDATRRQKWAARRILFGEPAGRARLIYDDDVHPAALEKFFRDQYEKIEEPEQIVTQRGDAKWITKPVPAATLAGFAASIGVSRATIHEWKERYPAFRDAWEVAMAIQEDHYARLGTLGALQPLVTVMALKNHQSWRDKNDVAIEGPVKVTFDDQDRDA